MKFTYAPAIISSPRAIIMQKSQCLHYPHRKLLLKLQVIEIPVDFMRNLQLLEENMQKNYHPHNKLALLGCTLSNYKKKVAYIAQNLSFLFFLFYFSEKITKFNFLNFLLIK